MFTVRKISGDPVPYVKGIIKSSRASEGVQPVAASEAVPGSNVDSVSSDDAVQEHISVHQQQVQAYGGGPQQEKQRKRLFLAKDLMSNPPFTVSSDINLEAAWKIIVDKRFRHLLVTNDDKKLCGVLSDRDLLRKFAWGSGVPFGTPISDIMRTEILTASPESEIREIAKVMFEERVGCVPIVSEDSGLEGIITRSDILRALLVRAPVELWI